MVGDVSFSGVVTIGGIMPHIMLQNTSLGLVYKMAEITANSIKHVLYKQQRPKKKVYLPQRNYSFIKFIFQEANSHTVFMLPVLFVIAYYSTFGAVGGY